MARVSIYKKGVNPGTARPKNPNLIILFANDIETIPERDANGVLISGDIVLKAGAQAVELYLTPSTISRAPTTEGDPDESGYIDAVSGSHPGNELEYDELEQQLMGEDLILITRECGDAKGTRLHGTKCNPMKLQVEGQDNNEAVKSMLTFTQVQRSRFKAAHYRGAIPTIAPAPVDGSGVGGL
ncbi:MULTISPECIES: hypothetical protein [Olivibacter]|jgi:hypothetical protein|uniref:Uncharacterized protein n=1 Tax=Olivibacter jilunii TaxID=985016 RepID=A0ABW6AZY0_9SPHI